MRGRRGGGGGAHKTEQPRRQRHRELVGHNNEAQPRQKPAPTPAQELVKAARQAGGKATTTGAQGSRGSSRGGRRGDTDQASDGAGRRARGQGSQSAAGRGEARGQRGGAAKEGLNGARRKANGVGAETATGREMGASSKRLQPGKGEGGARGGAHEHDRAGEGRDSEETRRRGLGHRS